MEKSAGEAYHRRDRASNRRYPGIIFKQLLEGHQILNVEKLKKTAEDGRVLFPPNKL